MGKRSKRRRRRDADAVGVDVTDEAVTAEAPVQPELIPGPPWHPLPTGWDVTVVLTPDGDFLVRLLTHTPAGTCAAFAPPEAAEKLAGLLVEHAAAARSRADDVAAAAPPPEKKVEMVVPERKLIVATRGLSGGVR
jgi:hypothetical protein